jgi:hypothetical protein
MYTSVKCGSEPAREEAVTGGVEITDTKSPAPLSKAGLFAASGDQNKSIGAASSAGSGLPGAVPLPSSFADGGVSSALNSSK